MKPMVWKPEYSVHDDKVDSQHRRLFDLYNQVISVSMESVDHERLLHDLYAYAVFHFAEEEALMATAKYPEEQIRTHVSIHASFFRTLERLRNQSVETALDYFREWLVHHIMTEDKEIGRFLEMKPL